MRRRLVVIGCCIVVIGMSGCGSSRSDDAGSATARSSLPTPATKADPPTAFDTDATVPLPGAALRSNLAGNVTSSFTTLAGRTAYIVDSSSLRAVDALTGKEDWRVGVRAADEPLPADPIGPPAGLVDTSGPRPPVLSADGATVVAAVAVSQPGSGTTAASEAIAVVAADTRTGLRRWSSTVAVPAAVSGSSIKGAVTTVVAATDKAVVVTYRSSSTTSSLFNLSMSASIDPATQNVLWQRDDYEVGALYGDVVVGTDSNVAENRSMVQVTALGLLDGRQRWVAATRSVEASVVASHPNLVVIDRVDYSSGRLTLIFLDPSSGETRNVLDEKRGGLSSSTYGPCLYDQKAVLVCTGSGVRAFSGADGKLLWSLPDAAANRVAPQVTAAWHGAVYGKTENGNVVLNAANGQDLSAQPGAAPIAVSELAGIGIDRQGRPIAFPVKA